MTVEATQADRDAAQDVVERVARAMREAVIRDDEGEFPRLFDLLDFSGENKAHTVVYGLARAAIAAMPREGMVLVPREPTPEQCHAAMQASRMNDPVLLPSCKEIWAAALIYRAMLDAHAKGAQAMTPEQRAREVLAAALWAA